MCTIVNPNFTIVCVFSFSSLLFLVHIGFENKKKRLKSWGFKVTVNTVNSFRLREILNISMAYSLSEKRHTSISPMQKHTKNKIKVKDK